MSTPSHIIPLEDFLHLLREEGFTLGVETWQQASFLLERAAARNDSLPQIRLKLCALIAKSPEAQSRFYRLFDQYVNSFAEQPRSAQPLPLTWWQHNRLALSMLGLFALLASLLTLWFVPRYMMGLYAEIDLVYDEASLQGIAYDDSYLRQYPPLFHDKIIEREWFINGRSLSGDSLANCIIDPRDQVLEIELRVLTERGRRDTNVLKIPFRSLGQANLNIQLEGYDLQATPIHPKPTLIRWNTRSPEPEYTKNDSIWRSLQGALPHIDFTAWRDSSAFVWDLGDGTVLRDTAIQHQYASSDSGGYEVELRLFSERHLSKGARHYILRDTISRTLNVPKIEALPQVPVSKKPLIWPDISDLRQTEKDYLLLIILCVLAQLIYGLYEYIRFRRQKLVLQSLGDRSPPLQQHLQVDLPDSELFRSKAFDDAATELRARRLGEAEALDVPATINASIEQAGLPDFRYRYLQQSSQYLVLVDQQHSRDHQARLYQDLVSELNERDISAALYFYRTDPSLCWKNPLDPDTQIPLAQLQNLYAGERLIVIGEGEGWLDPYTGSWADWADLLEYWPEKALLSTRPTELWASAERVLAQRFVLLPATEEGLSQLVAQWQADEARSPREWQYRAFEYAVPAVDRLEDARLVTELKAYLGPERFQWLCACALYPHIYYELSLQIGERILGAELSLEASGHLFRLPWFQKGLIPESVRLELVRHLSPANANLTRTYLLELLDAERNQAPKGSFAEQEQQSTMAIYRYLNSERTDEDLIRLREALKGMEPEDFEDQLSLQNLNETEQSPLAIVLPRTFFKGSNRFFGMRWQARESILLAIIALIWLLFGANNWWEKQQQSDGFLQEEQVRLATLSDSIRWFHYQGVVTDSLALGYDSASYWYQQAIALEDRDAEHYYAYQMAHAHSLFNEMLRLYRDSAYIQSEQRGIFFALSFPTSLSEDKQEDLERLEDDLAYLAGLDQLMMDSDSAELAAINRFLGLSANYFGSDSLNAFGLEMPASRDVLLAKLTDIWRNNSLLDQQLLSTLFVRLDSIPPMEDNTALVTDPTIPFTIEPDTLKIELQRYSFGQHDILGKLFINDTLQCFTLEDEYRDQKVRGETAIPAGNYQLRLRTEGGRHPSYLRIYPDMQRGMLWLQDVPGFEFIYLLKGNHDAHTSGEILIGDQVDLTLANDLEVKRRILGSDKAYRKVYPLIAEHLAAGKPAYIRILNQPDGSVQYYDYDGDGQLDTLSATTSSADSFLISGYVGWNLESRIPVQKAIVEFEEQQTTTNDSGRFSLWVSMSSASKATIKISHKDFASRTISSAQIQNAFSRLTFGTIRLSFNAAPPQMVDIPAGSFMMGALDRDQNALDREKPAHPVRLDAYQMGRYEVTVAQYLTFVEKTGGNKPEWLESGAYYLFNLAANPLLDYKNLGASLSNLDHPIVGVSWNDAQAYVRWLGGGYRLPTEAEWEYAARGGQDFLYAGSDDPNAVSNSGSTTHAVGQKAGNGYGLYDMSGNVYEWCQDWYGSNYYKELSAAQDTTLNPGGPTSAVNRVIRGGSWGSDAEFCRVSDRDSDYPDRRSYVIGFRLARNQ